MICPACTELRATESGAPCPECGATLVPATGQHLEDFVRALLRRRIERWRFDGLLDSVTAERLEASLEAAPEAASAVHEPMPEPPVAPPVDSSVRAEAWAEDVATSFRHAGEWRPGWVAALAHSLDSAAKAEREQAERRRAAVVERHAGDSSEDDLGSALGSGRALFSQGHMGSLGGGLEAMVALDEGEGAPRLHEYIWWFLGAVLVLGGSLMGVREAWRALGGVPRQLIVTGALFGYHAAFIGLGAFLSRRSLSAGRVLAGIGLALLPVVFVALSSLVGLTPVIGAPVALGVAAIGIIPLRIAGRVLHGASATSLAVALFPSLLAGLPLMGWDEAPWLRALCASAGVVALGATAWRARAATGKAPFVNAGAALYGALCLAVFAVASAPSGFDALEPGSPLFAGLTLWAMALASVVAMAASTESVREAHPRAGPVLETLAHAVVASGALAGALGAFSVLPGDDGQVDVASAGAPVLAALLFFLLEPRRRALVHPGVMAALLAGALLARTLAPTEPTWWCFGVAGVASALLLVARITLASGLRIRLLAWGVVVALAAMPAVSVLAWDGGLSNPWPKALTGLIIAVAAHVAGGWRWRGLHYLGGIAALFGGVALVEGTPWLASNTANLAVFALAAGLYSLAGLAQDAWARPIGQGASLKPLEDVSLGAAALGVALALGVTPALPEALAAVVGPVGTLLACAPTALATAVLLLRVRREGSRLVAFIAAMGLALAVTQGLGTVSDFTSVRAALVASALALGFALFAALRGRGPVAGEGPAPKGRRMLDVIPLPFAARGWPLFTDGFAAAALVQVVCATLTLVNWIPVPVSAERPGFLLAGGLLTAVALLAFVSRGFVAYALRGSVVTLATGGAFIALTAVINRAGRPLSPDVSAWRLPLIGIALWLLALATRRFGPWLGRLLENPRHGPLYHAVPHVGVAALALVLLRSAVKVGLPDPSFALGVVPPLLVLGPALLWLLLAASFRSRPLAHLGLLLGLPGAALWAAQKALLGPPLMALQPPDGQWVLATPVQLMGPYELDWLQPATWLAPGDTLFLSWQRAFAGVAAAGLVYAGAAIAVASLGAARAFVRRLLWPTAEDLPEPFLQILRQWSTTAVALVAAAAFFQPGLPSAGLAFATGAVLFSGGARKAGRIVLGLGLLLLVHAQAHRAALFEAWPGPTLALLGLAVVTLGPWVTRRRGIDASQTRLRTQLSSLPFLLTATAYALAVTAEPWTTLAVPGLLWRMLQGLGGTWMVSPAYALTLALIATTLLVGAFQWRGALAGFVASTATMLMGGAVLCALMTAIVIDASGSGQVPGYRSLFTVSGAALALAAAGSALALHLAHRVTTRRRSDVAGGMGWGRDLWLVATGLLLAIVAVKGRAPEEALPLALAAIGLAVGVSLHCAWREHTGRHVYFVQVAVVGVYALVRGLYAQGLRPEHDALFALSLGFVLVGVTVLARRAGVQPVERATRRFAALLPIGMALVLPGDATGEAALLAGGSGLLYAALGAVERSRMFGAFAAAACNLALLIAALAFGLEGLEVYLAPLGLLFLMMGQLFTSSLPQAARNAVRILGGLLLYVPAAAKLAMRMGESEDGTYALVFGAVCLLGVALGMALQIRAYLALGTLFLTLDVVANLLDAGLRDHRIGFLVMTLTGLTIVGGRVMATIKRQEWELLLRRVRVQLRGWD
ncbi:hypothetical protein D7Y13_25595 [Corallococcus praedator]|uniref:DUF2157 domain-containing protein n=1 Tax=Corallococcus praedator TaxID=2316724 RepID=A0ABX9QCZ2_9BACT|nr:hypothetical protein D7X75_31115 [Corallococcus sp. CA031C]RKI01088.1 hypothetical protein D7Y13_25595 [Corallococcus praedator]